MQSTTVVIFRFRKLGWIRVVVAGVLLQDFSESIQMIQPKAFTLKEGNLSPERKEIDQKLQPLSSISLVRPQISSPSG